MIVLITEISTYLAFSNRSGRYIFHPVIENSTFFVLCDQLGRNLFLHIAGNSTYFEISSRSGRNLPSTGYEDFYPFGTFKSLGVEKHLSRVTKISTIFPLPSQLGRNLQCNPSDFYIFLKRLSQYFFTRFLSARKSSEHSKYVILS